MSFALSLGKISRLSLGTAVALGACALAFNMIGGGLSWLVFPTGALIVAGGPVALLASTRSLGRLANGALAAGVIGVIMGLIHVMENLDKPETIGIGVALSLVAMVYALALALVLSAAEAGQPRAGQPKIPDLAPYALMAVTFLLLLTFAVLYVLRQ